MKKTMLLAASLLISPLVSLMHAETAPNVVKNELRPSAYPLITIDPYTCAWSMTDNLYDGAVKHWTGKDFPLIGVIKVDGVAYRFMGTEEVDLLPVVPTSQQGSWTGRYTTTKPAGQWIDAAFDDSAWKVDAGAFGTTANEPMAKTNWTTDNIWVRREFTLDKDLTKQKVFLEFSNDDDAIFYINGIEVYNTGATCNKNALTKVPEAAIKSLKKGKNLLAVHCRNPHANGLLDFGLLIQKELHTTLEKTAIQKSVDVQAMQTRYQFACGKVNLNLTFTAPMFMNDLHLLSRPINYISYDIASTDGKAHDVQIYFEASPRWALDQPYQESTTEAYEKDGLIFLKSGSQEQAILAKWGDDLRIDWGYFYLAAEKENTTYQVGNTTSLRNAFVKSNKAAKKLTIKGENANGNMAITRRLGKITQNSGKIMLGYDDIFSIQYFGKNLRPYWNSNGKNSIENEFVAANNQYSKLITDCNAFDKKLMDDATQVGGKKYAELCAVAYRQAIAAHKLVKAPNGDLLFLSKENNSNGSIGTVDITYPSSPLFLLYQPELAKGLMNHIYFYSESGRWVKPFPAHDVGTYPRANGQTYGGDMPVEEAGNMLALTAALAAIEGNANYADKHWNVLTTWTDYLVEKGLDPENQLCTDDFAGHFAHNANLSIKAIMGIASYGYLADMLGKKEIAEEYTAKARAMAQEWMKMADDKDHYRLTFDKPGTWSQKYNLVWDKLLKFNIFPQSVIEKEIPYYLTKQNKYGLPLDNRETYTKTDWIVWTATMAKDKATFEKFVAPVHLFMHETVDRIPMSDWVYTDKPHFRGFRARSVVGGYFIKMLEAELLKK